MQGVAISPQVRLAPLSTRRSRLASTPGLSRLLAIVRQSRRHGIWILAWSLVGWIGTALAPLLTSQPFLLMMLSPRALFVALASESVPLVPFVLLGTLRLTVTDASYYVIGRKVPGGTRNCSPAVAGRIKSLFRAMARRGDRVCRWFCARPRLAGAFLFVRPNGKYLGLAGAYGVSSWVAGLSATVGTAAFLTAVHVGVAVIF